jgi:ATP-dependent helicase HrpB
LHHIQQLALRWFGHITGNIQTTHSRQAFYDALGQISDVATMSARLCAVAFVDRIAKRRAADPDLSQKISYTMANGRGVSLMPNEPLASSLWLVIVDCDGQNNDGRVFLALAVNEAVIMQLDSVNTENVYEYSAANNKITGRRQTRIGQLVINETPLSTIPDDVLIPCFMQVVAEQGLRFLQWDKRCEQWCLRVQWLAEYCPDELPLIDEAYLLRHLNDWLLPYCHGIKTIRQLQQLALMPLLEAILTYEQQQFLAKHAPVKYTAPSGLSCHITYSKHQAPSVHIVLQEMFGQLTSPLLANGQVPLCFTLLSPARRDLQTTSDLAHFWKHSYFDVRKDMKGRYPKHRWPEKPLEERPGRSIKPKKTI